MSARNRRRQGMRNGLGNLSSEQIQAHVNALQATLEICHICHGTGIVRRSDAYNVTCPNGCPIPDAKPFRVLVASLPEAEQTAIANATATAEKIKALAKETP